MPTEGVVPATLIRKTQNYWKTMLGTDGGVGILASFAQHTLIQHQNETKERAYRLIFHSMPCYIKNK